ncbi:MAG: hypothetical protein EHM61_05050 [Acidobacteria bacterium]|nr:MAG: hypothetical protein EHM61_05050 [Acidobacteriota bacterium]
MQKHQTILASVFLVFGILDLIAIVVLMTIFGFGSAILFTVGAQDPSIPEPVKFLPAGVGLFISIIVALAGLPNLIAAYGLFKNRPWGMIAALLVGILNLLHFPIGTAGGIYAIWVYTNSRDVGQRSPVVL